MKLIVLATLLVVLTLEVTGQEISFLGSTVDDLKICKGWAYNQNTKKCYKNVRKRILFTEARSECKRIARRNAGGAFITKVDLASVHSDQESTFLDGLMGPTRS